MTIVKLSGNAPFYATFQSHNPHVVANANGIFVAYTENEQSVSSSRWVLKRSTDGGQTFFTMYTSEYYSTAPPALETDENNIIYAFWNDNNTHRLIIAKWTGVNYSTMTATTIDGESGAGKFSVIYDPIRGVFYYAGVLGGSDSPFRIIDKNGAQVASLQIVKPSSISANEYAHLAMDGTRLFFAWTTTPYDYMTPGSQYYGLWYNGIHYLYSDDGGYAWRDPSGNILSLPVFGDDSGPVPDIVPPAYRGLAITWLSSMTAIGGVQHFMYLAQPSTEIYQRFAVSPSNLLTNVISSWGGSTLKPAGLDGFLTHPVNSAGVLYAVGNVGGKIGVIKSTDNGVTWSDYAVSSQTFTSIYAINGARLIQNGSGVIGIFTDNVVPIDPTAKTPYNSQSVYFLHVDTSD